MHGKPRLQPWPRRTCPALQQHRHPGAGSYGWPPRGKRAPAPRSPPSGPQHCEPEAAVVMGAALPLSGGTQPLPQPAITQRAVEAQGSPTPGSQRGIRMQMKQGVQPWLWGPQGSALSPPSPLLSALRSLGPRTQSGVPRCPANQKVAGSIAREHTWVSGWGRVRGSRSVFLTLMCISRCPSLPF